MTKPTKWPVQPSEDSDQHGHPSSLIRVFTVCMKKHWVLIYPISAQRRLSLGSIDWQSGRLPRLIGVFTGPRGHFVGFVMGRLICLMSVLYSASQQTMQLSILKVSQFISYKILDMTIHIANINRAMTWQNHPPCLIRVFAVCMQKAWVLSYRWAHSEDSDQTGQMPRLIWVFAGRTVILLVLSRGGSYFWDAFCSELLVSKALNCAAFVIVFVIYLV